MAPVEGRDRDTARSGLIKGRKPLVVQSLSHVRLFATPTDCCTPGFSVLHYLPELAQSHVYCVGDAI